MKDRVGRLGRLVASAAAVAVLGVLPWTAAGTAAAQTGGRAAVVNAQQVIPATAGDGTPYGAVQWFQARQGYSGYEGYCEMAVENAYGTTGVWASAMAHWNGAVAGGAAHAGDPNPPLGAFVYWNISSPYGHVGISDGSGGFYSSSINGAIGHASSVYYFANYLGWSRAQVPHQ